MTFSYFVRVGLIGQVGRFGSADQSVYRRGQRVICRTQRGLEVGEVLRAAEEGEVEVTDGTLLRPVTPEDELLLARLQKNQEAAYQACSRLLEERNLSAVLMDVEHLFDGRSLYFYFLGEVTAEIEALTGELAEAYEAEAQFRKFAETLANGCGPDCGTDQGEGCGTSCGSCAVAAACGTRAR